MRRHVLLVGLSGSGKTAVGAIAARLLDARFVDVDERVEQRARMTVRDIFASRGEAEFRRLEHDEVRAILLEEPCVLAPGGGWAAEPGNLEPALERALIIYLRTEPVVAASRVAAAADRPLLAGDDPVARMRELLGRRAAAYERADEIVDTDARTPEQVGEVVAMLARSRAGW